MKKTVTGTVVGLALVGLGGLLAGFTPPPSPPGAEIRGLLSTLDNSRLPLSSPARDVARLSQPSTGHINLNWQPSAVVYEREETASSLLYIDEQSVRFLTENGLRPVSGNAQALLPLGGIRNTEVSWGASGGGNELLATALELAALEGDGEILGQDGRPLRWAQPVSGGGGPLCALPLSLPRRAPLPRPTMLEPGFHSMSMEARAMRYQETVARYARKYGLDASLVLAIMQTESGFNPSLVSTRQAHGLMQVVPDTAGDEVHRWLGRSGLPTSNDLLNPDNNIRYGTAYLHLLRTRHMEGIRDPLSQEYCVIAAYNGGSGAVLRHFGRTREEAFDVINSLDPQEVLTRLTTEFSARETRLFVSKVLSTRAQFTAQASRVGDAVSCPRSRSGVAPGMQTAETPPLVTRPGIAPASQVVASSTSSSLTASREARAQLEKLSRRVSSVPDPAMVSLSTPVAARAY